jgi:hypothetical protein
VTTESENIRLTMARHAEVVPSFVVQWVKKPLRTRIGDIQPLDLLRWTRPGDPSFAIGEDLRAQILTRVRVKGVVAWEALFMVELGDGWDGRLLPSEQAAVSQLCADGRPLAARTLKAVKQGMKIPLTRVLSILARIEAVSWTPPPPSQMEVVHRRQLPQFVDDALRALAGEALQLPWIGKVAADDLRFSFPSELPLPDWIAREVSQSEASWQLEPLLRLLLTAETLTAEQEFRELALAALRQSRKKPAPTKADRWIDIFEARHLSLEGPGRTLLEVAAPLGLTRERVRQITESFESVLLSAAHVTPAADRAMAAVLRMAPCSTEEANKQCESLLGPRLGIEALLAALTSLGRADLPLQCEVAKIKLRGISNASKMVVAVGATTWVRQALQHASRDCSVLGCTNVIRVAGFLALKDGAAPGQEALESALSAAAGFRWLDKASGWFSLGNASSSAAANRIRKIMAVADEAVGADQIAAAFVTDDMWLNREDTRAFATPPSHVLREMFKGWSFLEVVQKGRFRAVAKPKLSEVLSPHELIAVRIIESRGGIACKYELVEAAAAELGTSDVTVSSMVGSSPILVKVDHGLYALLGRKVDDSAFLAGRRRLREKSGGPEGAGTQFLAPNEFLLRVTEASLRNEQYSVPVRLKKTFPEGPFEVFNDAGLVIGAAHATLSGIFKGLNKFLPALRPRDFIHVTLAGTGVKLNRREAEPEPPTELQQSQEPQRKLELE